jgi:hypothetical protein
MAAETSDSPRLARITQNKIINVGYRKYAPPISFDGPGGQPATYLVQGFPER